MAKIIKVFRNNWKKCTFGAGAIVYGANYAHERYKIEQLMRAYCQEAVRYGEVPVPPTLKPRNITVILNPAANKRKAKANFEKYCAPLLHLAGFTVDIIQTESEGQARTLAAELKNTDVIVVAGGDGTLSEAVTGMMRGQGSVRWPVGVLPLGRSSSVASALLGRGREGGVTPAEMAEAAMAVVRGQTRKVDAIKVEVILAEDEEGPRKPIYSLSGVKWGAFRDALSSQDRYWYLGPLRGYAAVLFSSGRAEPVGAQVVFTHACEGCGRCYDARTDLHRQDTIRWYHYLLPSFTKREPEQPRTDYRKVVNMQCGVVSEVELTSLDVLVECPCICQDSRGISLSSGSEELSWVEYVSEGWRRVRGEPTATKRHLEAQTLDIIPTTPVQDKWFSIDNEEYEVRPIRVTLVPKAVQVFYPAQTQTYRAMLGCC